MNNLITVKWKQFTILKLPNDAMPVYVNEDIMDFLKRIDIKGKNVIDGGCSIGLFSLAVCGRIGNGEVFGFEIQPTIASIAVKNAIQNRKKNITIYNKALSDISNKQVGFTHIDYSQDNISSIGVKTEPSLSGQPHCGAIETISLNDTGIENIGLIKLDLEGNEPQTLEGAWQLIEKYKPYMIIELSPNYLENKEQETINKIIEHGYNVTEISDFNYLCEPK